MRAKDEYDHIVIGAGSAGCVLANRLSADPKRTVLVIEAGGPDRHPLVQLPMLMGKLMHSRLYTGTTKRSLSRNWTTDAFTGRAARRSAGPPLSTA